VKSCDADLPLLIDFRRVHGFEACFMNAVPIAPLVPIALSAFSPELAKVHR
jgi:hypothetical protein